MNVLIFDYENRYNLDAVFVNREEEFFDLVVKDFDVLIINFDFLGSFLDAKEFFKGYVIFVTSGADEMIYKKALEYGDYCYEFGEIFKLKYRIEYLKKRIFKTASSIVKLGDFILNLKYREVYKNREQIPLTFSEKELLFYLVKNRERFVSKEEIVNRVEGIDSLNSVKVFVSALRKYGFKIENIKNLGYKLNLKERK